MESALNLLNCKWRTANKHKCETPDLPDMQKICNPPEDSRIPIDKKQKVPSKPNKSWIKMNQAEKELWRYTLIAYNGGGKDNFPLEEKMREELKVNEDWTGLFLRKGYMANRSTANEVNSKKFAQYFATLTYMENILGPVNKDRERKNNLLQTELESKQSILVEDWNWAVENWKNSINNNREGHLACSHAKLVQAGQDKASLCGRRESQDSYRLGSLLTNKVGNISASFFLPVNELFLQ